MAFSCLFKNSLKQVAASPLRNVVLQNQFRLSSSINLTIFTNNKSSLYNNSTSQFNAVNHFSTSSVLKSAHGDHSKIWTAERALAAVMAGLVPAAIMAPSMLLDTLMAVSIVLHMHWGIEAIVIDYVRVSIFGTLIPKIALMLVYAMSIITLAGLLNFIFNDVGIANGIRLLWKL